MMTTFQPLPPSPQVHAPATGLRRAAVLRAAGDFDHAAPVRIAAQLVGQRPGWAVLPTPLEPAEDDRRWNEGRGERLTGCGRLPPGRGCRRAGRACGDQQVAVARKVTIPLIAARYRAVGGLLATGAKCE